MVRTFSTRSRNRHHAARRFKRLERRALLAGNIAAATVGTTLQVTGNLSGNTVSITQLADTSWQIKGVGTTVNGSASFNTGVGVPITDISVSLRGSGDTIVLGGGTLPE